MKALANKCPNLDHPERIRSTNLRKHIATTVQILSMKSHELELLANHLGKKFYPFTFTI
jgi:hypothetical protein